MCKKEDNEDNNGSIEKNYAEVSKEILNVINKYVLNEKDK